MTHLKWWVGAFSVLGLASACSSSDGVNSISVGGGTAAGHAGATAAGGGSSGGAAGASGGSSGSTSTTGTAGQPATGGSGDSTVTPVVCTPACTADQACVEGKCMPKPTLLTSVAGCGTMYLALNKGTLYFTDSAHGKVTSIPTAGGTTTDVATGQKAPYAVAVDDAAVYWSNTGTNAGDNTLMMKTTTGTPTKISDVTKMSQGITLDGKGSFYYGDGDDLMKVEAKAAATPLKIGTFEGTPTAVVITPARLFMTLGLDNAVQWRNPDPASSGCMDPVARPVGSTVGGCSFEESQGDLLLDTLTLVGTKVIWANGVLMQSADTTVDATMMGSGHSIASTASFDNISGFATTATSVYFGEATTGIIEKAPLPDGDPVILVEDPTTELAPSSFVMDATNLYWRTSDCSIMKLAL
jgi:hypothetical protein